MELQRRTHLGLAAALLAGLIALIPSTPAGAYNAGVKSLHFDDTTDLCVPGQALPCTANAGHGAANRIEVRQHKVAGSYRFDQLQTNGKWAGYSWFATEIGAECRTGYKVWAAGVNRGASSYDGAMLPEEVVDGDWNGMDVTVPDAKTMPTKKVAVNVPTAELFDDPDSTNDEGMNHRFVSVADVFAAGEDEIDRRIDAGMFEATARSLPYEITTSITLHGRVVCRGNAWPHYKKEKNVTREIPLTFAYVPVPVAPGKETPQPGGKAVDPQVTHAAVVAGHDPWEPCVVRVFAAFQASRTTNISYRLVDVNGQQSQLFQLRVNAATGASANHRIDLQTGDLDGPGLTTGGSGHPGDIDDYTDVPTDNLQGAVRIKVVSPNIFWSGWDGWNIDEGLVAGC